MRIILDGFNPDEKDINDPIFYAADEDSYLKISRMPNKMYVRVTVVNKNNHELSVVVKVSDFQKAAIPL